MKHVIIIYRRRENLNAVDFIKKDLEEIFASHVVFENFFLCDLKEDMLLEADAFLALGEDVFRQVKDHVDDFSRIIKMNRSPDRTSLNKISKIPANTAVLIVNDTYESSIDTVNSFYEVGISHINMIPFDEELEHTGIYDRLQIAVTPGESVLVPRHIKKIIDIGYRRVSFDTMFKLKNMLELDVGTIDRNLYRHIYSILEPDTAFHSNYIYGFLKSEMLGRIANSSKSGLILTDKSYQPVYVNDKAAEIFQCRNKAQLQIKEYIGEDILNNEDLVDTSVEILETQYSYSRHVITLMDEVIGYYIMLEEENETETVHKKKGLFAKYQFKDIVCRSECMQEVIRTARQIALTDHTVLIRGESGTGKELIAQSIHNASYRSKYEIGDISPKLKLRLLRTLQEHQIMRIGSDHVIDIDVRFITATNRDLEKAVSRGSFRGDLFYRLNVLPLVVPPLRERKSDIPVLLSYFLGNEYQNIDSREMEILMNYDWPGNVRELRNITTYLLTLSKLPEYILEQKSQSGKSFDFKADTVSDMILQIIYANTTLSHGVGRPLLIQELGQQGYSISDVKLRKILKQLQSDELIQIAKGRGGTRITKKGEEHLRLLQNG